MGDTWPALGVMVGCDVRVHCVDVFFRGPLQGVSKSFSF